MAEEAAFDWHRRYAGRVSTTDERLLTLGLAGLGLAHELNTPLTTLGLRLELLAEQTRAGIVDPAQLAEQLDAARDQAQRMGALIQRFRRFAQGSPGVPEAVTVDALLDETMQVVRPALAEAASARVSLAHLPGVRVRVDTLLVAQALSCLVFNASDLIGASGASQVALSAELSEDGRFVRLQVVDDGPGFADPAAATQLGWSSKGGAGMGVGLAFAAELAARAGGALQLKNRPEGGACAALILPRLDSR